MSLDPILHASMAVDSIAQANAIDGQIVDAQHMMTKIILGAAIVSRRITHNTQINIGMVSRSHMDREHDCTCTAIMYDMATLEYLTKLSASTDEDIQTLLDKLGPHEQRMRDAEISHELKYLAYVKPDFNSLSIFHISQLNEWIRKNISGG
jgi:hypothetical protein